MITEGVLAGTWRAREALVDTGKRLVKQDYNSVEERHSKSGPRQDTVGGAGKSGGEGGGGRGTVEAKTQKVSRADREKRDGEMNHSAVVPSRLS